MTATSAINNAATAPTSVLPNQFSKMTSEDFIKIIFTELSNQDPLQPNDSQALLNRLDSLRSIESNIKLTDQLNALVSQNQFASAGTLVGKVVGGLTADNQQVEGQVVSVAREGDSVNLELSSGWVLPITGVERIFNGIPAPPGSGGTGSAN